jgi:hypothetical protein
MGSIVIQVPAATLRITSGDEVVCKVEPLYQLVPLIKSWHEHTLDGVVIIGAVAAQSVSVFTGRMRAAHISQLASIKQGHCALFFR